MTTPNKQSPQVKSNKQTEGTKLPWYRSPIVWLGIVITIVIFIGCLQFLMLAADIRSHESEYGLSNSQDQATNPSNDKELTHILGVPISASSNASSDEQPEEEADTQAGESSNNSL